jgi:PIN domain nuclease of toxin-antitoxin system
MGLLLDTHVALWWSDDSVRLNQAIRDAVDTADVVFVSAASAWETSIKQTLGRLRLGDPFAYSVERSGLSQLPITFDHVAAVGELPTTPVPSIAC